MAKKQVQQFSHDELHKWAVERILNGLLDGNLRSSVSSVVDMAVIWGRQNKEERC